MKTRLHDARFWKNLHGAVSPMPVRIGLGPDIRDIVQPEILQE
jgi:hypothetical protein